MIRLSMVILTLIVIFCFNFSAFSAESSKNDEKKINPVVTEKQGSKMIKKVTGPPDGTEAPALKAIPSSKVIKSGAPSDPAQGPIDPSEKTGNK